MSCCGLEKCQGHHVLATLCVQRLYFQFILVGGLLTGSDTRIMAKNRCYLAHVSQLGTCCDLENSVKSHRFDKHFILHYTCIPVNMVTVITLD